MTANATLPPPEDWRVLPDGTVPLTDVAASAACSYASVDHAVRTGLVEAHGVGGRGNPRRIALEDALMIVAVAALAVAAGLAFNVLFRSVKETGARMTAEGLTIPLNAVKLPPAA